jgi:hypothetical protein
MYALNQLQLPAGGLLDASDTWPLSVKLGEAGAHAFALTEEACCRSNALAKVMATCPTCVVEPLQSGLALVSVILSAQR